MSEQVKPVPVSGPESSRLLFALRGLVDLQFRTIHRELCRVLPNLEGSVLDVGAGNSPWRHLLGPETRYAGLDLGGSSQDYGFDADRPDVVLYDGRMFPFSDNAFDAVLCIEVLEHTPDPPQLLAEIRRVLTSEGRLVLSVPWSARRHHIPHDYFRFTREGLVVVLSENGFCIDRLDERGSDIAVIANKLIIRNLVLLKPRRTVLYPAWALAGLLLLPITILSLGLGHLAVSLNLGAKEDPLGYFVVARSAT